MPTVTTSLSSSLAAPHGRSNDMFWIATASFLSLLALAIFFKGGTTEFITLALVPLLASIVLRSPETVAAMFYVVTSFRLHEGVPNAANLGAPKILGIMVVAAMGIRLLFPGGRELAPSRQLKLLAAFAVAVSIGVPFAKDVGVAFDAWSEGFLKSLVACLAIAFLCSTREHVATIVRLTVAAGAVMAPFILWNKFNGFGLVEGTRAVIAPGSLSILADPNFCGQILMLPFGLSAAIAASSGLPERRLVYAGFGLLIAAGIIATQSRGAFLGLFAVLGVLGMKRIKSLMLAAVLAAGAAVGLAASVSVRSAGSLGSMMESGLDASSAERLIAWGAAINMALKNPLTGVGIGGFHYNFYDYTDVWVGRAMDVHSTWFQVLSEAGFLSFALYIAALITAIIALYGASRRADNDNLDPHLQAHALGFLASGIGLLVTATFISNAFSGIFFGLICISHLLAQVTKGIGARQDGFQRAKVRITS